MKFEEIDESLSEEKKQAQIQYRTKKNFSRIFMFFACIYEIIETLLVILGLFLLITVIMFRLFGATGTTAQTVFSIMTVVIFFGGLFLGFFIYKKTLGWVIEKFKLEEKLTKEILMHYKKMTKEEREEFYRK